MTQQSSTHSPDRFRLLMMAALDRELSSEEEAEFQALLASSPERQREWEEFKRLKEIAMNLRFSQPPQEVWDRYWLNVYNRIERGIGWILVLIGAMIVLFFGGYKAVESLILDSKLELFLKIAILAVLAGAVILFVSVAREKLFTRKTDKYKEVQR